jgi:hypothetical protein
LKNNFKIFSFFLLLERGAGKLELLRGDIIVLDDESKKNMESGLMTGVNDRTNREGEFPADVVYIIPCTNKPDSKVLVKKFIFFLYDKINLKFSEVLYYM